MGFGFHTVHITQVACSLQDVTLQARNIALIVRNDVELVVEVSFHHMLQL